jgi:membrane protein DedA with SNARE-associated domain
MSIFHQLTRIVLDFFRQNPFATILVLLTIEEAGIPLPLPGDTLLVLAGIQHGHNIVFSILIIACAAIAVIAGSSVLFFVMHRSGRPLLEKYGKVLHISEKRLNQMEAWFLHRGQVAIVAGRLIPGLRIPTTIMSGLSDMPYRTYLAAASIAAVLWATIYFLLGVVLGRSYSFLVSRVSGILDNIPRAVLVIFALIFLGLVVGSVLHLRSRHDKATETSA